MSIFAGQPTSYTTRHSKRGSCSSLVSGAGHTRSEEVMGMLLELTKS
jgi:hypothetical protein